MNALMVILEIILVGCAIAFLIIDPKEEVSNNVVLITILVAVVLHMVINILFICRGKWFCFNCK